MITATAWVPRGHAAAHPTKYEFDEEEYERISKLAKLELEDAKEDLEEAKQALNEDGEGAATGGASKAKKDEDDQLDEDDDLKEYDMEHYDDDDEIDEELINPTDKRMFAIANAMAKLMRQRHHVARPAHVI